MDGGVQSFLLYLGGPKYLEAQAGLCKLCFYLRAA